MADLDDPRIDDILADANGGDKAAVGRLLAVAQGYAQARLRLQRTDQGVPPDEATVMSIVQDVLVRVTVRFDSRKGIQGGRSGFKAFLRDSAYYLWLDHLKAGKRPDMPFPTIEQDDPSSESGRAFNPLLAAAANTADPLDAVLGAEESDLERELIDLAAPRYVAELDAANPGKGYKRLYELQMESWCREATGEKKISQTEMAKAIGCSQPAVSIYLNRIFGHIHERWQTRSVGATPVPGS